jgi:hypothetical protein
LAHSAERSAAEVMIMRLDLNKRHVDPARRRAPSFYVP